MAEIANSAAVPPAAPVPAMATAVPGHRTLPQPLPDLGPPGPPPPEPGEENDPWRFGWRYLRHEQPNGEETYEQVPLSWDDLLYPEEEDFVVQNWPHRRDADYLYGILTDFYEQASGVVVLGDHCIDFGAAGIKTLGPDVVVFYDVRQWLKDEGTFNVARDGGRPVLVIEVASPNTRGHDLLNKPDLYYRAGVEKYVIVDRGRRGKDPPRLLPYQRGPHGWVLLPLDAQGRVDLSPVSLLLGLEGDRPWLYDARTGERQRLRAEEVQARVQAEGKARDAEGKARDADAKAQNEAKTRAALEERVSELEQQLRNRSAAE